MCAEGETKGVIKRGEVVTEMCTQGFSFFLSFFNVYVFVNVSCAHWPVHVFNFHASWLPLIFYYTHTGPDTPTHTHTLSGLLLTD